MPKAESKKPGRNGTAQVRQVPQAVHRLRGHRVRGLARQSQNWIQAIYLIGASKKGISAHQIHRMFRIAYRAAWFTRHRL